MRIAAFALLAPLAPWGSGGCRGILDIDETTYVEADAGAHAACADWRPRGLDPCELPAPAPALVLRQSDSPYTLDTTTRTLRGASGTVEMAWREVAQADQSKVLVVAVERLTIETAARLEVIGKLPLVLASWSAIEVGGTIDAGSHAGGPIDRRVGPGANMICGSMTGASGANAPSIGGSGGGGGGAFRGRGGAGARGGETGATGGGGALAVLVPGVLRGGCGGGASGAAGDGATVPSAPSSVSLGGAGGGAIYLAARESIAIGPAAAVLAGGAGGEGASLHSKNGGGGGGSGGYIGLQAGLVDMRGTLAANGGAGGGGASFNSWATGGTDGLPSDRAADGGASAEGCSAGGGGAAAAIGEGASAIANTACGGGGGGGGSGFVMVWAGMYQKQGGATVSPGELLNTP